MSRAKKDPEMKKCTYSVNLPFLKLSVTYNDHLFLTFHELYKSFHLYQRPYARIVGIDVAELVTSQSQRQKAGMPNSLR